jgi:hypothetical protein
MRSGESPTSFISSTTFLHPHGHRGRTDPGSDQQSAHHYIDLRPVNQVLEFTNPACYNSFA